MSEPQTATSAANISPVKGEKTRPPLMRRVGGSRARATRRHCSRSRILCTRITCIPAWQPGYSRQARGLGVSVSVPQLSVFVENKPGHLADTLGTLAAGGVNVLSFTIADTNDYGILRLVVDKVDLAKAALGEAGYMVVEHPVVCALLPDQPDALAAVVRLVSESGLDIEYIYQGTRESLLVKTEELERLEDLLVESGFRVLGPGDLL